MDTYKGAEIFVAHRDILIRKRICQIYIVGDGEKIPSGSPGVVDYTVSLRNGTNLKTAYVKLGNVPLGWFKSTPKQGIHINELQMPEPFKWKTEWPPLEKLLDCDNRKDIENLIEVEFGIRINQYLGAR